MKTYLTTVALALTSLTLYAQDANAVNDQVTVRTRAEVRAETLAAIARGEVFYGEVSRVPQQVGRSTLTRSEVGAEVLAATARGERLAYGEVSPDPVLPTTSTLTRAEVRADLLAALARGERPAYGEVGDTFMSLQHAVASSRGQAVAATRPTTAMK